LALTSTKRKNEEREETGRKVAKTGAASAMLGEEYERALEAAKAETLTAAWASQVSSLGATPTGIDTGGRGGGLGVLATVATLAAKQAEQAKHAKHAKRAREPRPPNVPPTNTADEVAGSPEPRKSRKAHADPAGHFGAFYPNDEDEAEIPLMPYFEARKPTQAQKKAAAENATEVAKGQTKRRKEREQPLTVAPAAAGSSRAPLSF